MGSPSSTGEAGTRPRASERGRHQIVAGIDHCQRNPSGDARLHVARAGARRRARSPVRHVLVRRPPARTDDGAHPFLRADAATRWPPSSATRLVWASRRDQCARSLLVLADAGQSVERPVSDDERARRGARGVLTGGSALAPESTARQPARYARAPERTFVGREAEATELRRLLDESLAGHGTIALVGGEPGIGKTRLARELLREARQRGCLCLTGHCDEMAGAPPFAPFIETMEDSGADRRPRRRSGTPWATSAPEIATIMPSLRRTFPDIPPPPELPPDQQRRLVFSAYRGLRPARDADVAARRPVR